MRELGFIVLGFLISAIGIVLLRDVLRTLDTGITDFLFQWPDGFLRDEQPLKFYSMVSLYIVIGVFAVWFGITVVIMAGRQLLFGPPG